MQDIPVDQDSNGAPSGSRDELQGDPQLDEEPGSKGKAKRGRSKTAMTPEDVKKRKDSHKEVERRRREGITEGINQLRDLLPVRIDQNNKKSILQAACDYIHELQRPAKPESHPSALDALVNEQLVANLTAERNYWQERANAFMIQRDALAESFRATGGQVSFAGEDQHVPPSM